MAPLFLSYESIRGGNSLSDGLPRIDGLSQQRKDALPNHSSTSLGSSVFSPRPEAAIEIEKPLAVAAVSYRIASSLFGLPTGNQWEFGAANSGLRSRPAHTYYAATRLHTWAGKVEPFAPLDPSSCRLPGAIRTLNRRCLVP